MEELQDSVAKLTTQRREAQDTAKSAQLKKEIRVLEAELAAIAKEQAEMDKIRMEAREDYVVAKRDLELGLKRVRDGVLCLLQDYRPEEPGLLE